MRITILAFGSRGDVQPFLALGLGLKKVGYTVKIATHANFEAWVKELGFEFTLLSMNPQEMLESEAGQAALNTGKNLFKIYKTVSELFNPCMDANLRDAWVACQDADAIIGSPIAYWGLDISQKLGVPFFWGELFPSYPTNLYPMLKIMPVLERLGGWYNRFSYHLIWFLFWQIYRQPINNWRVKVLNFKPVPFWKSYFQRMRKQKTPWLRGFSSAIVPTPKNLPSEIHSTGYWFLDAPTNFVPPADLVDFLAKGKPPIYVGFGSMGGETAAKTLLIVLEALQRTGERGILVTGWSGISNSNLPDTIFKINSIPHAWLLSRVAAAVHHCGAGTTAAVIRAGIPHIPIPFAGDQPSWADMVMKLGVGTKPLPHEKLTVESLTDAFVKVQSENMQTQAALLGEKVRAENGVPAAVSVLQHYLSA
ncbi:MAG: glycosyltransferase family 1 protein [Dolichospermum sp. OL03]|nr:glycosyltransferase family 1 protein [Dolichospermum sp. OL03]MCS6281018.1 glycosyltransferase family 1 protein [Dolichospermum sp.]